MRYVAVVGTRHKLRNRADVSNALEEHILHDDVIVTGDASGVDTIARDWAFDNGHAFFKIDAPWGELAAAAGPVRNEVIARVGDALFAFPCKHSRGTRDTIRRFKERGIENRGFIVECESE